ncbi:GNAT family N-acetyltransferase [Candidatus Chlorohelix allophototropha]|uniref:GNAT family N-acetyltransferase n=1 Tax=Candidatus Chlorohelix allophototropha TaxID=3003348 RepID=A0ABY9AYU5_9CHLR|nr:GNAT family N-acetyltransferase [Chloroflexota bacterium L227-S17]
MNSLRIATISKPTPEQWESIENNCDYATFYQTHMWHNVLCSNPNPYCDNQIPEDVSQLIRFSDGVEMLLPLVRYKKLKGIFHLYSMSPDNKYGNFLSKDEITAEHEQVLVQHLRHYNLSWRQNPFKPLSFYSGFDCEEDNIWVLDMRGGVEELRKKWETSHKGFLRHARQSPKLGVTVGKAETLEQWREFYEVYLESTKRWDYPKIYSWSVFEAFYNQASDKVQLWAAWADGKIIAGNIVFCHNHTVTGWIHGSLKEYFHLKAPKYLDLQHLEYYAQEGYWWYDMGSAIDPGIVEYKARLGCEKMEISHLIHKNPSLKAYERVRWESISRLQPLKGRLQKAMSARQENNGGS